jgi:hypothetical protein
MSRGSAGICPRSWLACGGTGLITASLANWMRAVHAVPAELRPELLDGVTVLSCDALSVELDDPAEAAVVINVMFTLEPASAALTGDGADSSSGTKGPAKRPAGGGLGGASRSRATSARLSEGRASGGFLAGAVELSGWQAGGGMSRSQFGRAAG